MHIKKYTAEYSRRALMAKGAAGVFSAGVLSSVWPMIARGQDISSAYPDELLSIEGYTKGKISTGDQITAENVDIVKDLLDPIAYKEVKEMGRRITIVPTTTDMTKMFGHDFLEATLRNKGKAKLDANGNVVYEDGSPWKGGAPFPEPKDGKEALYNLTLSWGRNDFSKYGFKQWDVTPKGKVAYEYDIAWVELNATSRNDGTVIDGKDDLLRLQSVWFHSPQDIKGTSFLSTWYADQNKFPDLHGYLPAFRRVRQFPTNQRFEPIIPGATWFLSDAWASGDPMLTWGNFKTIGRKPMLGAVSGNWRGKNDNWVIPRHGGPKGETFFETYMEFIPEAIVMEAEPVGFTRAPVSKKRVWIDARNTMYFAVVTYDNRGEVWKSFETGSGQLVDGDKAVLDAHGKPVWTWNYVHAHDIQSNRMSALNLCESVGNTKTAFSMEKDAINKYLTPLALQRIGSG